MDPAIDTLSTTSEHSVASSSESTTAMQSSKRSSHSPSNYSSNHTGSTGGSITGSIGGGGGGSGGGSGGNNNSNNNNNNNRSSSAIGIHHQHHLSGQSSSSVNGNLTNIIDRGGNNNNNNNHHYNNSHHHHHNRRSLSPSIRRTSSISPPPSLPQSSSSLSQIPLTHRIGGGGSSGGHPSSPPSSAAALSHQQMMQQMQHQLSPPHVTTPNSLGAQMGPRGIPHLPPHSLGLLNSLQMMHHASPLELMAAAHHHVPPRSYNSPPPISTSDPSANECKLVEYRGQKVAAFIISGDTMLCLPQAFELFLKHLVGGLHTVYTKLKRLDIVPLVCNVEQVRILRGLGAIQPGVNRCKLLSCKDFDILYRDCTTARCLSIKPPESSRPGRPPKRGPVGLSLAPTHLSGHPQLKKHRLDNGDYAYENGHITDISRLDKSPLLANGYNPPPINHMAFMQMNHHPGSALMSPGIPPHSLHRPDGQMMKAAAQAAAAGGMSAAAGMDAIARSGIWENCRAAYEDIVKHLERNYRLREERTDDGRPPIIDQKPRDLSSRNGSPGRQSPVLNLSKSGIGPSDDNVSNMGDAISDDRSDVGVQSPQPSVHGDNDNLSEDNVTDDEAVRNDKEEDLSDNEERNLSSQIQQQQQQRPSSVTNVTNSVNVNSAEQAAVHLAHQRAINYSTLAASAVVVAAAANSGSGVGNSSGVGVTSPNDNGHSSDQQSASSTETLLRNIQSLLKVAADNARQQERQITYEKAELKMDVLREREVKDSLERQLVEERKLRVLYQKRYRRERKMRIRLQQQIQGKRKSSTLHPDDQFKGLSDSGGKNCQDTDSKSNIKIEKLPQNERNHRRSSESPAGYNTRSGGSLNESNEHNSGETSSANRNSTIDRNERIGGSSSIDREGSNHPTQTGSGTTGSTTSGGVSSQVGDGVGNNGNIGNGSSNKGWNYPGIDLMATGAFWQNYSETLAQEIEMERKARQQNSDRDVKSPLQERQQAYYKNSVLFGSAT